MPLNLPKSPLRLPAVERRPTGAFAGQDNGRPTMAHARRLAQALALLAFMGCAAETSSSLGSIANQADVRDAYLSQFRVLAQDRWNAIARDDRSLLVYGRNADREWKLVVTLELPADWRTEVARRFETFVDEARLSEAYLRFCEVIWGQRELAKTEIVSSASQMDHLPYRGPVRLPATSAAEPPRCFGSEGRYAYFIADPGTTDIVGDGYCGQVAMSGPRLVLFRADNGRDWLVLAEAELNDQ